MLNLLQDLAEKTVVPAGAKVFRAGDPCKNFYYVASGTIRVDLQAHDGRSILLYRIEPGETCVLTTACIMSGDAYNAEATTESDVTVYVLPKSAFDRQMNRSDSFRSEVLSSFSGRIAAMMAKVDEVAFQPIDARLARRVLVLCQDTPEIHITHDQLAHDLGSAREVISRKLKQWERQGIIHRDRGVVTVLDRAALGHLQTLGD